LPQKGANKEKEENEIITNRKGLMNQIPTATAKIRLISIITVNYYFIHSSV